MTGVEILTTEEVAIEFGMNWGMFFGFGLLFTLGFAFLIWCALCDCQPGAVEFTISIVLGLLIGPLFGIIIGAAENNAVPIAYETQYKVTIDESVSMVEFNEKYEIIDQEDKIYTIRERE